MGVDYGYFRQELNNLERSILDSYRTEAEKLENIIWEHEQVIAKVKEIIDVLNLRSEEIGDLFQADKRLKERIEKLEKQVETLLEEKNKNWER